MPINFKRSRFQAGLTLIELMISIALGVFVLLGLVYLTSATMRTNAQTLRATHLNQELRAIMHLITRDMRRAGGMSSVADAIGFSVNHSLTLSKTSGTGISVTASSSARFDSWVKQDVIIQASQYDIFTGVTTNSCLKLTSPVTNDGTVTTLQGDNVACPNEAAANAFLSTTLAAGSWKFANPFSPIYIVTDAANAADVTYNCIILGYDKDKNSVADSNENFGFRWDTANKAVEEWRSGTIACNGGTWNNLSDDATIEITNFTVTRLTPTTSTLTEYKVELAGRLKSEPSVTRSIEEVVRLRNDTVI